MSPSTDREIVISRTYEAPRELVFEAFTSREHVDHWWGPNGFRNATHEMDVRPGGIWRYTMHGPDGTDWPNYVTYLEVVPPERLLYDHGAEEGQPPHFQVTITFAEVGAATEVTLHSVFPTAEAKEATAKFGAVEGGKQTLAKLDDYLAQMRQSK